LYFILKYQQKRIIFNGDFTSEIVLIECKEKTIALAV